MKILLASSEVHPYSKTGGLADMAGSLAKALVRAGHKVAVLTPLYSGIRERFPGLKKFDWRIDLPLGNRRVQADILTVEPLPGLTIYFVDQPAFFNRPGLYTEKGADYSDNAERFIFFSKCVVQMARYLPWHPEIVHINDWQCGLVPLLMLGQKLWDGWLEQPRTVLTIHNLAFQGLFDHNKYPLTNLPWEFFNPRGVEFYGQLSCLKAGIVYADTVTTVSPTYAREITTVEQGCGLDDLLRKRQNSLAGILNGVDYEEWNTNNNSFIKQPYSAGNLEGKAVDKAELQKLFRLPVDPRLPLFGIITRLADQKGLDILLSALEEMLSAPMQFALLGSGSDVFQKAFLDLARRHPKKVSVRIGFEHSLSHQIEAGCDFYLMPSKFEPCGLNQMYSLRYGTIPIVRATGGLDDSVIDITEDVKKANGIKFTDYSSRALAKAIRKALALYAEPELMRHYQVNGMEADFSWDRAVKRYEELYGLPRHETGKPKRVK